MRPGIGRRSLHISGFGLLAERLRRAVADAEGAASAALDREARAVRDLARDTLLDGGEGDGETASRLSVQGTDLSRRIEAPLRQAAEAEFGSLDAPPTPFLARALMMQRRSFIHAMARAVNTIFRRLR